MVRSPRYGQLRYFLKARFVENEKLNNFPLWSKDKFPLKFSRFCWFLAFDFLLSARARARARPPTVTGAGSAHFPERGINSFFSAFFARARFTRPCSVLNSALNGESFSSVAAHTAENQVKTCFYVFLLKENALYEHWVFHALIRDPLRKLPLGNSVAKNLRIILKMIYKLICY